MRLMRISIRVCEEVTVTATENECCVKCFWHGAGESSCRCMCENDCEVNGMRESAVEEHLVKTVKDMGGRAYKFVSPGNAGVPDRIVIFPNGVIAFTELKAPGAELRPLQRAYKRKLEALGQKVYVIDSKTAASELALKLWEESEGRKTHEIHTA